MSGQVQIIQGNLLSADTQYIAHQCNCRSKTSKGLAKDLFRLFPHANVYSNRLQPIYEPGTILICGDGLNQRRVINMFGQFHPGKPKGPKDNSEIRLNYFEQCLDKILEIPDLHSISFPYNIGCGLAGGDWTLYLQKIEEFSTKRNIIVRIYQLS